MRETLPVEDIVGAFCEGRDGVPSATAERIKNFMLIFVVRLVIIIS